MAYILKQTDGRILVTILDGTADGPDINPPNNISDLDFFGRNYPVYGEKLNENFVKLLQNFANTDPPSTPLNGELWYDTSTVGNHVLRVWDESTTLWRPVSPVWSGGSAPLTNISGAQWWDTVNQQLDVYNGTSWIIVGPLGGAGQVVSEVIVDNASNSHNVISMKISNVRYVILSKDATFTPQVAISGFTTVRPGITLSTLIGSQIPLFQGTATLAQGLVGGQPYMLDNANTSTTGTCSVLNNTGLFVGTNSDLHASVSGTTVTLQNQTTNGDLNIGGGAGGIADSTDGYAGTGGSSYLGGNARGGDPSNAGQNGRPYGGGAGGGSSASGYTGAAGVVIFEY